MDPTLAGFLTFIRNVMGINTTNLPDNTYVIQFSFAVSMMIVNQDLRGVISPYAAVGAYPSYYALAVYNLGGDRIINYALDPTGSTYFTDLREKFHVYNFNAGVVSSTNDESTGGSFEVLEVFKNLTIAQLQLLSTPWGREYLGLAQAAGPTIWGLS